MQHISISKRFRFITGLLFAISLVSMLVVPALAQEEEITLLSAEACANEDRVSAMALVDTGGTDPFWVFGIFDPADTINTVADMIINGWFDPGAILLLIADYYAPGELDGGQILLLEKHIPIEMGQDLFVVLYMDDIGVYVKTITGQMCGEAAADNAAQQWLETSCGVSVSAVGGPSAYNGMWLVGGTMVRDNTSGLQEIGYWREGQYVPLGWYDGAQIAAAENQIVSNEQLATLIAMCGW
jgi:hypothetical protein